jgi:YegS/Rv2252/BmrU family lipid kinase
VAVVAHRRKSLDGGLDELRRAITTQPVEELLWYEVNKSKKAPKVARQAVKEGAELLFVWGGDGMVQRCVDAVAGLGVPVAVVPAGTANLLASNLGIPEDLQEAVRIGFDGRRRSIDLGVINGERFAVMAGAGFDAMMIRAADRGMKAKLGQAAYVWTGLRSIKAAQADARVRIDGADWFEGRTSCVLVGNVGTVTGGLRAFEAAEPDDGWLEVGVVTAKGAVQWARTFGRAVVGNAARSPFVRTTRAKSIDVRFDHPVVYELDGGDRPAVKHLEITVEPGAIEICVPDSPPG